MKKNRKGKRENETAKGGADRLTLILAGWAFFFSGVLTPITGGGKYKGFEVYNFVGYIQFVIGSIILIYLWRTRKEESFSSDKDHETEETICPKCQKVYMAGKAPANAACDSCGAKLEPLEGFYERHPELKETPEDYPQHEED
ncbi:hypothetical protein [Maridesulfovibrio sp.]|uniref:hypothetical protein n=1 Tax=Maridesulfovibrio sp. TaxID=2795000 RepID=UPI0029CAA20E|nr:hypothetical protein [Maridesulfovibrio sp.]